MHIKTGNEPRGKSRTTGQCAIGQEQALPKTIVIKGNPGTGKSTLVMSVLEQARQVKSGLPACVFTDLAERLGSTREALSRLTNIPARTLNRRMKAGVFQQDEGERVLRVARVLQAALGLFSNDLDRAKRWLNSPDDLFDGATPLEFSDTEPGALYVLDIIGRLEHGVFN